MNFESSTRQNSTAQAPLQNILVFSLPFLFLRSGACREQTNSIFIRCRVFKRTSYNKQSAQIQTPPGTPWRWQQPRTLRAARRARRWAGLSPAEQLCLQTQTLWTAENQPRTSQLLLKRESPFPCKRFWGAVTVGVLKFFFWGRGGVWRPILNQSNIKHLIIPAIQRLLCFGDFAEHFQCCRNMNSLSFLVPNPDVISEKH